jgi:NitT/TauT family transport system substrate-binding protein
MIGSLRTLVAFIVIFIAAAYYANAQTKRVIIGYSSLSSNQTPIWVGKEEGFFKKFGLDADLILIEGGTRGAQALISGDLPFMSMSGQPVISARARGADLVLIGGAVNRMNYIMATNPKIKRPEDLKGKRIGATQVGSSSYHAVMLSLKHWGLDPRRDGITILQVGTQAARVGSLQSGGSDAAILNPGLSSTMTDKGFNILADFSDLPIPYPHLVLGTRERLLKGDSALVESLLKGFTAATAFSLDPRNKEKVKATLAKYLRLERTDRAAEEQYQSALKVMPRKPYVELAGISSMIEFMTDMDPLVAKLKPEEVVHNEALKKLDDSGWIDQLYRR